MNPSLEHRSTHSTSVIAQLVRATHFSFSNKTNWVARIKRAMTDWGKLIRSAAALIVVFALTLSVAGCGVKSDLVLPDGKPSPKGEKDPSKPPSQQQGR
jgi:predicted small lipoprotein YifL